MNIALILQMAAETAPGRTGLVCEGQRYSYAELHRLAAATAVAIQKSGAAYVALLDENSAAALVTLFGAAMAGVPYVPLNYRLADADLAALLGRISPAFAVGDADRIRRLDAGGAHVTLDRRALLEMARGSGASEPEERNEDTAVQLFTSGTTGTPKAALLKHGNIMSYILGTVEFACADENEASVISVPPYHIAGISALLSSTYAMRRAVLLPAFEPGAWLRAAHDESVSNAFVVPTMLARIIDHIEEGNAGVPPSLKAIAYGGGRMPAELIRRALDLFPDVDFTNAYGLTETSSTIALLGPREHREAQTATDDNIRRRLASVGLPLPTVEVEIRNEAGHPLPPGEQGEIYVRGEQVSGQYRERSALDADGWFPTRDAGWLDEDGYLYLAGRADDVIVRGGENISPGEIEDVLTSHESIADAAAVGIPSEEWGEAVGIAVVVKPGRHQPTETELRQLIKTRLRSSRLPERCVFTDELPYNDMGKLLRRDVRRLF